MQPPFDHTWETDDCEAVFRIMYTVRCPHCIGSVPYVEDVDVDCIAIKLQDDDGNTWHEEKQGTEFVSPALAISIENRFEKVEGEEAIEALCLADHESKQESE